MKTFEVDIKHLEGGLSPIIAVEVVKVLNNYGDRVDLFTENVTVDAKSILGVISLAAYRGETISFRVMGDNAAAIENDLKQVFK